MLSTAILILFLVATILIRSSFSGGCNALLGVGNAQLHGSNALLRGSNALLHGSNAPLLLMITGQHKHG